MATANKSAAYHRYNMYGMPYNLQDPTRPYDKEVGVIDEPQVLVPMHGGLVGMALRSNRADYYTSTIMELSNVVAFPVGFSQKLADVGIWLATFAATFNILRYVLPLTGIWWLPYVAYGLLAAVVVIPIVGVCLHRHELIIFAVLRAVLILIAFTL